MIDPLNKHLFLLLNNLANKTAWFDWTVVVVAEFLPFLFITVLIYYWFSNTVNNRNNALYAGYSSVLGISINLLITLFYFHPRPFMENVGVVLVLIDHIPETSFPSDHTTFMLSISITLLFIKETRKTGLLLSLLGLIGGLSRVICGIHYPVDIFGSLIVATTAGVIMVLIKKKLLGINKKIIPVYARIVNEKA